MTIEKIVQKYPANLRHTIFKEIMHYEILESLFSLQEIQNTLVFQGGTALRLCYNNDRYSEDLDFVINKNTSFDKEFMKYFKDIFIEKILQKYSLEAEITEPKKDDGVVQRWSAKVFLPNDKRKSKINIEIANIPSYSNHFQPIKNNYDELMNKRIFVQVETLEEIFADKILALSQRPYLKFRDLWDIEWLKNNHTKINYDLVELKIEDYKCNNFLEMLKKRKDELENKNLINDFLNEMNRFLYVEYFNQVKNINFFETIKKTIQNEIDSIVLHFEENNKQVVQKSHKRIQK
ncbi:nucleotidyl transferase AbiEii/AbiGii toxin family protein [Helicobacter labetoulli]|uniref:nucleotidyl transferase AbiEii/AbiGii toxin family protein n=1 Tax=Helicobacter labetoulli TaxID=2315333 RepID=UPI0013003AD2|nr:nucleotidyl transferase AbiEii/AbiGii toxin family protein [Helicobacter labetoulli]